VRALLIPALSLSLNSSVENLSFFTHFTKKKFNEHTSQKRKIEQSNKAAAAAAGRRRRL